MFTITDPLNREVERCKIECINAQVRGDQQAIQLVEEEAESLREAGATMALEDDTAITLILKQYYEHPSIKQALASNNVADLNRACEEADRFFVQASMSRDEIQMEAAAHLYMNLREMATHERFGEDAADPLTDSQKMIIETVIRLAPFGDVSLSDFILLSDELHDGRRLSDLAEEHRPHEESSSTKKKSKGWGWLGRWF